MIEGGYIDIEEKWHICGYPDEPVVAEPEDENGDENGGEEGGDEK